MTGRRTIVSPVVILLAICLSTTTFLVFAGEEELITDSYAPGFYYTIKKGDTLWDLSRKFYDSEWEWPAMWGQNTQLTNPHLIYPGMRIRLHQRVDAMKHTDTGRPAEEAPTIEAQAAPEEQSAAPAPLPETVYYVYPKISYIGFVQKLPKTGMLGKPVDPLAMGMIFKTEGEEKTMISQGDKIYIKSIKSGPSSGDFQAEPSWENDTIKELPDRTLPDESMKKVYATPSSTPADPVVAAPSSMPADPVENIPFIIGNQYSIYKPLQIVDDPITGEYAGHQYEIAGIAEVTAVAPEFVVAKIVKSIDIIRIGDFVMPFEKRNESIPLSPAPDGLTGEVLLAENRAEMSSQNNIVFINKGERDGVQEGQRYVICFQEKSKIDGREILLPPVAYGELLVLLTRETTATATITKSDNTIKPGTTFKSSL